MFNIIEKFLKSFFRLAGKLHPRDLAEFLRSLILVIAILWAFYLGAQ